MLLTLYQDDKPLSLSPEPPSSPRLSLTGEGVPSINGDSIRVCWLPALDSGGLDDLRYNVYLYVTNEEPPVFNRVNSESIVLAEGGSNQTTLCHNLEDIATDTSYGIIVVSANSATGDPQMLANVDDVQGRSVVFFLTLGELAQVGSTSCNGMYVVFIQHLIACKQRYNINREMNRGTYVNSVVKGYAGGGGGGG